MKPAVKGAILGASGAVALLVLIALLVVITGAYNVAATERHTTLGAWALDTNFVNSVRGHGADIPAPELTPAMVAAGAPEYKSMCAHCHGGVGEGRAAWAAGMRPQPPALADAARQWSPSETYWLVAHGAKMTGMPAFGPTHDERTIWNIVAFVKALPSMSAKDYAAFPSEHGDAENGGHHGGGEHPDHQT